MKSTVAKVFLYLQWWVVVVTIFFTTIFYGGIYPPAVYVTRLLIILSLIFQVILFFSEDNYLKDFHPLLYPSLLMFLAFLGLVYVQFVYGVSIFHGSIIGSLNPYATFSSWIQLVFYFLFFLVCIKISSRREFVERLGSLIAVLVFGITIAGLAQKLFTSEKILWRSYSPIGWSFFGPFVNENHFGGFLGLTFPLALGVMHYRFNKIKHEIQSNSEKKTLWVYWNVLMNSGVIFLFFIVILTLAGCFFSRARMSSLVLLFCCAAYFIVYGINKKNAKFYLTLLIVVISSFLLLQWLGFDLIVNAYGMNALLLSWMERSIVAKESLALFSAFPFFGTGLGTYPFISAKVVSVGINSIWRNHAHNDYVELLTDTGIFGFFLFLAAFFLLFFFSVRKVQNNPSHWSQFMVRQAFISILLVGVMEFTDFHLRVPSIALLLILQSAILFQSSYDRKNNDLLQTESFQKRGFIFKSVISLGLLGLCGFLLFFAGRDYKVYQLSQFHDHRVSHLKEAIRLQPPNAKLWFELAREYEKGAEEKQDESDRDELKKEAIAALRKAATLNPGYAQYWYYLGVFAYSSGFEKEGVQSLEKAVFWSPARLKYSIYLLAVYLRESERNKIRHEKIEFLARALTLYKRLQRLKEKPVEYDYKSLMGEYYFKKLQSLTQPGRSSSTLQ